MDDHAERHYIKRGLYLAVTVTALRELLVCLTGKNVGHTSWVVSMALGLTTSRDENLNHHHDHSERLQERRKKNCNYAPDAAGPPGTTGSAPSSRVLASENFLEERPEQESETETEPKGVASSCSSSRSTSASTMIDALASEIAQLGIRENSCAIIVDKPGGVLPLPLE